METNEIIPGSAKPVVSYNLSTEDLINYGRQKVEEGRQEAMAAISQEKAKVYPTLTRKEAMARLGISESTIILWGKRGLLRKVKHGHACYYYEEDIDRLLQYGTE